MLCVWPGVIQRYPQGQGERRRSGGGLSAVAFSAGCVAGGLCVWWWCFVAVCVWLAVAPAFAALLLACWCCCVLCGLAAVFLLLLCWLRCGGWPISREGAGRSDIVVSLSPWGPLFFWTDWEPISTVTVVRGVAKK